MTTEKTIRRREVAPPEGDRGQVPERGAEGERREHRRPVEALAPLGGDAVDRERSLAALPAPEDGREHECPEDRGSRVGDVDVEVQEVRDARSGGGDRVGKEPVRKRLIAPGRELPGEPYEDQRDLDAARPEVPVRLQVVRGRLPSGGRQDLHDPEEGDDLRDLRGQRRGEVAPEHGHLILGAGGGGRGPAAGLCGGSGGS